MAWCLGGYDEKPLELGILGGYPPSDNLGVAVLCVCVVFASFILALNSEYFSPGRF